MAPSRLLRTITISFFCRPLLRPHEWTLCHEWTSQDDARHKHAMGPSDLNGQGPRQPDSLISITVLKAGTPFQQSRNLLWLWVPLIFTSLMIADSTPCSPLTLLYCCALQNWCRGDLCNRRGWSKIASDDLRRLERQPANLSLPASFLETVVVNVPQPVSYTHLTLPTILLV